jgi:phage/plasmid-associated DNA primase
MEWTNKLIKFSFPGIDMTFNKTSQKYKKDVKMRKGWAGLTETKIYPNDLGLGALTGVKSGVVVLDFDDINLYNETIENFPELEDAPRVATKNGFHLYFKWKESYQEDLPGKIGKLDILKNGKCAIFPGTSYKTETGQIIEYKWVNQSELIDLPDTFLESLKIEPEVVETDELVGKKMKCTFNKINYKCLYLNLIGIINLKYIDEYNSWFHLMCAMHNLGKQLNQIDTYKSEAIKMSKRSKKYDLKDFENTWSSCKIYNFTPGSIKYYARLSDKNKYNEICRQSLGEDSKFYSYDEKLLADYIQQVAGDSLVFNRGVMYVYNKDCWKQETKEGCLTQCLIENELTHLYEKILLPSLYDRDKNDSSEENKNCIKIVYKTKQNLGVSKFKNIYQLIKNRLTVEDKNCEIFDRDPYIFSWKNTSYNLKMNEFFKPQKFDYILSTNDLEYHEPSVSEMNEIKYIFESIFPDPEMRKAYISILKSGLSALRVEKFIVCTGEGRNGKGVLNDFFQILLGKYFGNLSLTVLTKPFKEGANSELRSIDKKRFLKATEPDSGSNEKLRMSNIKGLTGENTIKARGLYEADYDITISATIILECNTKPYIITDGNEAERQRLLIIPFEICFTDNEEDIKSQPDKYKPKNDIYKTTEFKEQHASALFMFLVSFPGTDLCPCPLYIPDKCIQLALQWVQDKDNLCSWFFDTYEPEEGSIISCSEVFSNYRCNLPKEDKNMKLKDFTDMVSKKLKNIYLKPKEYYTHSKGTVRATANSIKGYRKKVESTFAIIDDPE